MPVAGKTLKTITPIKRDCGKPLTREQLGFKPGHWQLSQDVIEQARKATELQAIAAANFLLLVG
jgi:hypothetical protein